MTESLSRRTFLRGLLAVTVVGFDSARRGWATAADVEAGLGPLAEDFPTFEGQLLIDDATLDAAADDFGHYVYRRPQAVLAPGSVEDIVRLVRFARRHGIAVAARGQGHSTQGQAQAEAGVVINMSRLATVHDVQADAVWVDAGVRWRDLLEQHTLPQGLTPSTLTDYPYRRAPFRAPLLRVPAARHFFLFGLLRNAVPPTPALTAELIKDNRQLFEQARALGGMRYPINSVPMTPAD